jgi:hypothetical protein
MHTYSLHFVNGKNVSSKTTRALQAAATPSIRRLLKKKAVSTKPSLLQTLTNVILNKITKVQAGIPPIGTSTNAGMYSSSIILLLSSTFSLCCKRCVSSARHHFLFSRVVTLLWNNQPLIELIPLVYTGGYVPLPMKGRISYVEAVQSSPIATTLIDPPTSEGSEDGEDSEEADIPWQTIGNTHEAVPPSLMVVKDLSHLVKAQLVREVRVLPPAFIFLCSLHRQSPFQPSLPL